MGVWPNVSPQTLLEMELIATATLGAPATGITVGGISTDYRMFEMVGWTLKDANTGQYQIRFNNDGGSNYNYELVNAANTSFGATQRTAAYTGILNSPGSDASTAGAIVATFSKPITSVRAGLVALWSYITSAAIVAELTGGDWMNTADQITRVDLLAISNNLATGSTITLGGARAA